MMRTEATSTTTLYLIRHGATEANLARPARLQGRKSNPPLALMGVRQAEATRQFLSNVEIQHCYSSPMRRAVETAAVIAEPHDLEVNTLEELTECDVGRWEGMDWKTIRYLDAFANAAFHANPSVNGYPDGETFADVLDRVEPCLNGLLEKHKGETILVVAHHVVNRTYLARLLDIPPERTREVSLSNCGVSIVTCEGGEATVTTVNANAHLQKLAA